MCNASASAVIQRYVGFNLFTMKNRLNDKSRYRIIIIAEPIVTLGTVGRLKAFVPQLTENKIPQIRH